MTVSPKEKPAPAVGESRLPTTKTTDQHHPAGCARQSSGSGERVRCDHCRRPLRVALSVARKSGPTCWRRHKAFEAELCRALDAFTVQKVGYQFSGLVEGVGV
jgi:hypothetical protein